VTYYTASPNGNAYFVDFTTGQYISVWFNEPSPTNYPYVGATAEWVLERPSVNGNPVNLTDYEYLSMEGTYNSFPPGSGPASGPYYFVMTCPPWNPSSACPNYDTWLSYVSYFNPSSGQMVFTPTGPTVQ